MQEVFTIAERMAAGSDADVLWLSERTARQPPRPRPLNGRSGGLAPASAGTRRHAGFHMADPAPAGSDVSAGTYRCTACGYQLKVSSTEHLPPCRLCADVNAVTGLSASRPSRQSPTEPSMKCLSCAAGGPKRVGVPNANPSAQAGAAGSAGGRGA